MDNDGRMWASLIMLRIRRLGFESLRARPAHWPVGRPAAGFRFWEPRWEPRAHLSRRQRPAHRLSRRRAGLHGDQFLRHLHRLIMLVNGYQAPSALTPRSGPVADDRHARQGEPQRVLGQPIWDLGPHARQDEEPQRVMGYPIDSLGPSPADLERLRSLAHPIRTYKRWMRRRRLGPYATGQDEP